MRAVVFAFAVVVAVAAAGLTDSPCNNLKDINSCYADKQDNCTWCKSSAVPSACYSGEQAVKLPGSIFHCGEQLTFVNDTCESHPDEEACKQDTACAWCVSHAVPSKCVDGEMAKKLPPSVFQCSAGAKIDALRGFVATA